jgi:glycosyltransferase involved in cell wall biosynthesis
MIAPLDGGPGEAARQEQLVRDAVQRGQAALAAGDRADAVRWLERAHRLSPGDGTITLVLASAAIGYDNPRAVQWFDVVLASADLREARFGLASARLLMGDVNAACAAVAETLSRHMVWPNIVMLADQVARATGAAGWCGLTGAGVLAIHPVGPEGNDPPIEIRIDGAALDEPDRLQLPAGWPQAGTVTVTVCGNGSRQRHFLGSPISLRAIGRVEGHVEAFEGGIRGWAWCPSDPDTNPNLTIGVGRLRRNIVADGVGSAIHGLAPLARPRSFAIRRDELPVGTDVVSVRGRDGQDLTGSPVARQAPGSVGTSGRRRVSAVASTNPKRSAATARRQALLQWHDNKLPTVVLVTHNDGGGVERRVQASITSHQAAGRNVVVMRPPQAPSGATKLVNANGSLPEPGFELPREKRTLLRFLAGLRPVAAELHHLLNHDPSVVEIIRSLGIPYDAHVHDYAWFCPRIALVGRGDRYCGEPPPAVCQSCVSDLGHYLHEGISVAALLDRSRTLLTGAQRIIAPSHDASARLARHFPGISPVAIPHEDDTAIAEPPPIACTSGTMRVCIAGAIGLHKGFDVLLACALDARRRNLELTFVVAGTTIDDQRLMDTGRVFVTGPYQPDEAVDLIRSQRAHLGLLPSIWPETWCLGLTELWRAGMRVAAFDIGAPAERIRQTGRGFLLPLHMTPGAINDTLLQAVTGRSLQPPSPEPSAYKVFD